MTKQVWLLYDGRYRTDEDAAMCYEVCDSLQEAKYNASDYGTDTVIVECTETDEEFIHGNIIN